jgi:hypothetical protein
MRCDWRVVRPPSQAQSYGPQMQAQGGGRSQPFFQYSQCGSPLPLPRECGLKGDGRRHGSKEGALRELAAIGRGVS